MTGHGLVGMRSDLEVGVERALNARGLDTEGLANKGGRLSHHCICMTYNNYIEAWFGDKMAYYS